MKSKISIVLILIVLISGNNVVVAASIVPQVSNDTELMESIKKDEVVISDSDNKSTEPSLSDIDNESSEVEKKESEKKEKQEIVNNKSITGLPNSKDPLVDLTKVFGGINGDTNGSSNVGLKYNNKLLYLTDTTNQTMSIWAQKKVNFDENFEISGYIYLGDRGSNAGDGMTLAFQKDSSNGVGWAGQYLGAYPATFSPNSLFLEFDTYYNGIGYDSDLPKPASTGSGHHIAFTKRHENQGLTHYSHKYFGSKEGLSDGTWKKIDVKWNADKRSMNMIISVAEGPNEGTILYNDMYIDKASSLNVPLTGEVYWGFTGATGSNWQENAMVFSVLPSSINQDSSLSSSNIFEGETTELKIKHSVKSGSWLDRTTSIDLGESQILEYVPDSLKIDGKSVTPIIDSATGKITIDKGLNDLSENTTESIITLRIKGKKPSNTQSIDIISNGVDEYDVNYDKKNSLDISVKPNPDNTSIVVKDSSLYQGQTYNPEADNFVSATDVNGNPLKWDDSNLKVSGDTVDMNVPKIYNQTLTYTYSLNGETKTKTSNYKVEVKEDQTKLELKDVELYVGEKWDPDSPFKNVTDKDGKKLTSKDFSHYYIYPVGEAPGDKWLTKKLDTSVAGKYKVQIFYFGNNKYSNEATITVKEDQTKLELKDTELYVGETFDPDAPFKNVTDKYGEKLTSKDFSHYYIYPVGEAPGDKWLTKKLDTSVAGKYNVQLFYWGNGKFSNKATITVKEKELSLSVPNDFSFGNTVLGKAKKLYWDKKSEVLISNEGNRKWDLTTKLTGSSNQDFSNYLKFKDQSFKEGSVLIDSGASSKNITNELTEDKFIYADYSTIKEIRKDKATLEWTLSPSTKEVEE